jgi:hypothetical protein
MIPWTYGGMRDNAESRTVILAHLNGDFSGENYEKPVGLVPLFANNLPFLHRQHRHALAEAELRVQFLLNSAQKGVDSLLGKENEKCIFCSGK